VIRMLTSFQRAGSGGCFGVASSPNHPPTSTSPKLFEDDSAKLDSSRQNIDLVSCFCFLPRQSGLRPRASVGAQRTVLRGPSLGELTPAGANNSQDTLHVAKRPTDDDGVHLQELESTLAFALLPPSESNVLRIKIKSKINFKGKNKKEELCQQS